MQAYGRFEVADLNGDEWLRFLDRTGGNGEFTKGSGSVFGRELYKPKTEVDPEKLFPIVAQWIRKHK